MDTHNSTFEGSFDSVPAQAERDERVAPSFDWDGSTRGTIALELGDDDYTSWAPPIVDEQDQTESEVVSASDKAQSALTQAELDELQTPSADAAAVESVAHVPTPAVLQQDVREPGTVATAAEVAPPTWTLDFIDMLVPDPQKRVDLVDSIVALSDGLEKEDFLKIYLEIYREDPAVRMAMIAAVSDFGAELAGPILSHALTDDNTQIVTEAFNRLVLRGDYELAAGALRNVEVAAIAMIGLQPYLPDIEQRLEQSLSDDDVRKVREQLIFA
jgi:hypothetical protein